MLWGDYWWYNMTHADACCRAPNQYYFKTALRQVHSRSALYRDRKSLGPDLRPYYLQQSRAGTSYPAGRTHLARDILGC